MRKNTSFAIAAAIMGLALIFWAKSSVIATSADTARPGVVVTAGSYLPTQMLDPIW
jgi:hypothetical protein